MTALQSVLLNSVFQRLARFQMSASAPAAAAQSWDSWTGIPSDRLKKVSSPAYLTLVLYIERHQRLFCTIFSTIL